MTKPFTERLAEEYVESQAEYWAGHNKVKNRTRSKKNVAKSAFLTGFRAALASPEVMAMREALERIANARCAWQLSQEIAREALDSRKDKGE